MSDLVTTFAALADQTRLSIVERLMTEGELSAGELTHGTGISAPAVSRHLKVLRMAGVVQQRVDGTKRFYTVQPVAVQDINDWTTFHRGFWTEAFDRLATAIALDEEPTR